MVSSFFICFRFAVEGAVDALLGGALATGVLSLAIKYLVEGWLAPTLGADLIHMTMSDLLWVGPILLALGAILAIGSSVVSLNRYLKV